MKENIITTRKTEPKRPIVAFWLSLLCTGLGQMYNGDLAKGLCLCFLRILPLLFMSLAAINRNLPSYIFIFFIMAGACLFISIIAPFDALMFARKKKEMPVKRYNSIFVYPIFFVLALLMTAASGLIVAAFFTIESVADEHNSPVGPVLTAGDLVLIKKYQPRSYTRGELVIYNAGSIGRIMALEGDAVSYENNIFFIDKMAITLGYLSDDSIANFSMDREDIISELNEGKKYPIRFKASKEITIAGLPETVQKGYALVASDTRLRSDFASMIPVDSIRGRVEGIVFSGTISKIMMDANANLK